MFNMPKLINPVEFAHSPPVLAFLGLFTHLVLHRDEWDNDIYMFLWIWLAGFSSIAAAEYVQDPSANTIGVVIKVTVTAAAIYFGTLSVSVLAHRVLFHRLRKVIEPHFTYFRHDSHVTVSRSIPCTLLEDPRSLRWRPSRLPVLSV